MDNNFLKELREERKTYKKMFDFCCDDAILNNDLIAELSKKGYMFDPYCGNDCYYVDKDGDYITADQYEEQEEEGAEQIYNDIYQYFIINYADAERFKEFTNELILYNDELDLYILCVTHYGTAWDCVPANWQELEE